MSQPRVGMGPIDRMRLINELPTPEFENQEAPDPGAIVAAPGTVMRQQPADGLRAEVPTAQRLRVQENLLRRVPVLLSEPSIFW
ncbi:MAG: hypothetical protein HZB35_11300 [Nitrospirae bacterium]|nr:hypothetical protein [Nitrospirota bacterium]